VSKRSDLDRLTQRWRDRHDARRPADDLRPRVNPGREALARRHFPYRDMTPEAYVAEHGAAMVGFTYDDEAYADPDLDAWLLEVGRLLREPRQAPPKPKPAAPRAAPSKAASAKKPAAKKPAAKPKADG
jgi:hypothetical protein